MSVNDQHLAQIAKAYLPSGAELVRIVKPIVHPAVIATDVTGDHIPEIAGVSRFNEALYLFVPQYRNGGYEVVANVLGQGYAVNLLIAAPVLNPHMNQLIVGWRSVPSGQNCRYTLGHQRASKISHLPIYITVISKLPICQVL